MLLWGVAFALAAQERIFDSGASQVLSKSIFIDNFDSDRYSTSVPLTLLKSTKVVTDKEYIVNCLRYRNWGEDPGDFHCIMITVGGKVIFTLENGLGWDNFSSRFPSSYTSFYMTKLDARTTALFFVGASIMSQPEYLTIVVLRNGKATLVFNKKYVIGDMVESSNSTLFKLFDDYQEVSDNAEPKHKLVIKDGMIYFEICKYK